MRRGGKMASGYRPKTLDRTELTRTSRKLVYFIFFLLFLLLVPTHNANMQSLGSNWSLEAWAGTNGKRHISVHLSSASRLLLSFSCRSRSRSSPKYWCYFPVKSHPISHLYSWLIVDDSDDYWWLLMIMIMMIVDVDDSLWYTVLWWLLIVGYPWVINIAATQRSCPTD